MLNLNWEKTTDRDDFIVFNSGGDNYSAELVIEIYGDRAYTASLRANWDTGSLVGGAEETWQGIYDEESVLEWADSQVEWLLENGYAYM